MLSSENGPGVAAEATDRVYLSMWVALYDATRVSRPSTWSRLVFVPSGCSPFGCAGVAWFLAGENYSC